MEIRRIRPSSAERNLLRGLEVLFVDEASLPNCPAPCRKSTPVGRAVRLIPSLLPRLLSPTMKFSATNQVLIVTFVATTITGCGNKMVDLKARVTLDGQPLSGAAVTLVSSGEVRNRSASGTSDEEGRVRFTTFKLDDGVLPGAYKVTVFKAPKSVDEELATYDPNNPEDLKKIMARERSGNLAYTPTVLPRAYLSPDTSPLECTAPSDTDEVVFNLDSSFGKKR